MRQKHKLQTALRVYVTPEEHNRIARNAVDYGLTVSAYLRTLGLNPKAVVHGATPNSFAEFRAQLRHQAS